MTIIVPRWEWRTFGEGLGAAGDRLGALPPEHTEESDEVYLLAGTDGDTVKIRAGLMDIKHLKATNADGLQQWTPVMKAEFPLGRGRRGGGAHSARRVRAAARAGLVHRGGAA